MVLKLGKYAGKEIELTIRDEKEKEGFRLVKGYITSFKDNKFVVFEIKVLKNDNEFESIKVEDLLLINLSE